MLLQKLLLERKLELFVVSTVRTFVIKLVKGELVQKIDGERAKMLVDTLQLQYEQKCMSIDRHFEIDRVSDFDIIMFRNYVEKGKLTEQPPLAVTDRT